MAITPCESGVSQGRFEPARPYGHCVLNTARVVQIYGLRRYNLLFTDGYVQKLLGTLYLGTPKPKAKEILAFAEERWGRWQAYALDLLIAHWQSRRLKPLAGSSHNS